MFKKLKEEKWFLLLLGFMIVYYGVHLFTLTPWYDELYTYYSFISRGPLYAAIHWPVPNNHVFYSTLSAVFDLCGNSYIGLRGVSYLSALANMIILYHLSQKFFSKFLSLACVCFYISVHLVNNLAIQGRGYTFTTMCYLLATLMLYYLCVEPTTVSSGEKSFFKKHLTLGQLIIFSICLTLGLYAIPSSLYWVLPTCFVGGFFLLLKKEWKRLISLIISAMIAALNTLIVYAVIWLAIGANLVSKDIESAYYGIYQFTIVLKAPVLSLQTGMQYMLDTPYIQSIPRIEVLQQLFSWCHLLFDQFYSGVGVYITILLCISLFLLPAILITTRFLQSDNFSSGKTKCGSKNLIFKIINHFNSENNTLPLFNLSANNLERNKKLFIMIYLLITLCMFPLMLIIQSVLPYQRVFVHLGVFISLLFVYYISYLVEAYPKVQVGFLFIVVTFTIAHLLSPDENLSYGGEEAKIQEAFDQIDITSMDTIFYIDDYQKYVLKFYWDLELTEVGLEEADCVLVAKEILENKEQEIPNWPILYTYQNLPFDEFDDYFSNVSETEDYILYYK